MKYELILFDADGTLYDFKQAELQAFNNTMLHFGVSTNLTELHLIYEIENHLIWQEFEQKKISSVELRTARFSRFFKKADLELDPNLVSPFYLAELAKGTHLLEGAIEIIQYLYGKVPLAIATNGLADVQIPRFADSKLHGFFEHNFISDQIGHPKPEPEFFQHIFEDYSQKPKSIIIGDNLDSDIKGGNDFGIDTCWYNPNRKENKTGITPTYEIANLAELKQIIEV